MREARRRLRGCACWERGLVFSSHTFSSLTPAPCQVSVISFSGGGGIADRGSQRERQDRSRVPA